MSRTYRKRVDKPHLNWKTTMSYFKQYNEWSEDIPSKKDIAMHYSDNGYSNRLPKWFRKQVNKNRRNRDKAKIYKAININGYEEQCSKWNCKDNNHWGYY